MMKKLAIGLSGSLALLAVSLAAQQGQTFTGEIMDSQCAMMGSHEKMVQKERIGTEDKKQCTLACIKMSGKFVLYNAANKTVYQLDDQKKPEPFAGSKVTITGTFNTIHVTDIKPGA
ncbi:MAG TPA: hypothetical protein VIG89_07585 [Candidatus Acidoferrales bacterium]